MDYKALVKTVRDAGNVNGMVDHETLRDSNHNQIELLGSEERLTWGMVIALCDAVEALEKDRELLDRMEALMLSIGEARIDLNFYPEEHGSVMEGEPDYYFPGGFQVGDDSSKPYHPTLRACIAAHLGQEVSDQEPAAPSDA